ncbi:unnamed protein product [Cunninghamella echinulata]
MNNKILALFALLLTIVNVVFAAKGTLKINGKEFIDPVGCKSGLDVLGVLKVENHLDTKVEVYSLLECKGLVVATVDIEESDTLKAKVGLSVKIL